MPNVELIGPFEGASCFPLYVCACVRVQLHTQAHTIQFVSPGLLPRANKTFDCRRDPLSSIKSSNIIMNVPRPIPPCLVCQSDTTTPPSLDSSSSSNASDTTSTLLLSLKKYPCSLQQKQHQHVRFSQRAHKRMPLLRTQSAPVRARNKKVGKPKDQQPATGSSSCWPLQSFMLQLTAEKESYCHGTLHIAIHLDNAKLYSLPMESTPTQTKRDPMSRTKSAPIQAYHRQPTVLSRSSGKPRRVVESDANNKVASPIVNPLSPMITTRTHSQALPSFTGSCSSNKPGIERFSSFQSPQKSFSGATTSSTSPNTNKNDSPPIKPLRRSYSAPIERRKRNNITHLQPVSRPMSPEEEGRRNQLARLMRSPASVHKDTRWKNAVLDVNQIAQPDMVLHFVV
jgi:hypothetical protein